MKTICLFFLLLLANASYSQNVPESVFPLGGFGFGYLDSTYTKPVMDSGRFNALFNADAKLIYQLDSTRNGYVDISDYFFKYTGHKNGSWHCSDMRFFLASQDKYRDLIKFRTRTPEHNTSAPNYSAYNYDLIRSWKRALGGVSISGTGNEWEIEQSDNPANGILLDSLQVDRENFEEVFNSNETDRAYYTIETGRPFDGSPRLALCDFIYRIDTVNIASYRNPTTYGTDNLYEVQYVRRRKAFKKSTGELWSSTLVDTSQSVFITKNNFKNKGGSETLWATDHPNIKNYDGRLYAILRTPIRIEPDTMSGDTIWRTYSIECRLKTSNKSFGIFVRGLRIRSVDADSLLRGNFGSYTHGKLYKDFLAAYYAVRKQVGADSVAAWTKIKAFTAAGESSSPSWRALAYIENQWQEFCKQHGGKAKRIYTFLAENTWTSKYAWYRAIFEDETGKIPPPLFPECDGLSELGLDRNGGTYPLGYPRDIIPRARQTQVSDFTLFCAPIQEYDTYTVNYQAAAEQLCKRRTETLAAFPPNAEPSNWISLLNSRMNFRDNWLLTTKRADSIKVGGVTPLPRFIKDQMKAALCNDWQWKSIRFSEVADTNSVAYTHTTDTGWNNQYRQTGRSLTGPELRADAWQSICFGAKGLLWNTLGTNGGHDVGLVNGVHGYQNDWWDDDTTNGIQPLVTFYLTNDVCKYPAVPENKWDYFLIEKKDSSHLIYPISTESIPVSHTSILTSIVNASPVSKSYDSVTIANNLNNATTGWESTHPAGSGKWWAPAMVDEGDCRVLASYTGIDTTAWKKNKRWAAFFDSTSCSYSYSYHYPYKSMVVNSWIPTFYGFKERFRGAQSVSNDVIPIATTLSKLKWQKAFPYAMLKDSNFKGFPLRGNLDSLSGLDETSQWVERFTFRPDRSDKYVAVEQYDSSNGLGKHKPFIFFGLFKHPIDSAAQYVTLTNHRTWTTIYTYEINNKNKRAGIKTMDTPTDSLKGAIDVRRFNFRVNPTAFGDSIGQKVYSVTDLRNGREKVISGSDTFSVIMEPGEGTLLRVAPAIGLTLGQMSSNLYNNARHIAAIETDTMKYACVYERSGKIAVSYPVETPTGTTKRIAPSPVDTEIDSVAVNATPAVAYNPADSNIGVVYQGRRTVTDSTDMVYIYFKKAKLSSKTTFSSRTLLDSFLAKKNFVSAPAITSNTKSTFSFWTSWRHPLNGIAIGLLRATGSVLAKNVSLDSNLFGAKFISIATHSAASDSLYIGFEVGNHIYFGTARYDTTLKTIIGSNFENISSSHPYCKHHHPEITVSSKRRVSLVWEATDGAQGHNVVYRERDTNGKWSNYTTIRVFDKQHSATKDTLCAYPTVAYSSTKGIPYIGVFNNELQDRWNDKKRIMWNNPTTQMIGVARFIFEQNFGFDWRLYNLIAPSLEPAVPALFKGDSVAHPLLYHSPSLNKETQRYDARITQYDFPITSVAQNRSPIVTIVLKPQWVECNGVKVIFNDHSIIKRKDSTFEESYSLGIGQYATSPYTEPAPVSWGSSTLRTNKFKLNNGDTIRYNRHIQLGQFEGDTTGNFASTITDTAMLISALGDSVGLTNDNHEPDIYNPLNPIAHGVTDTVDYVKVAVLLRNAVNDNVIAVLDSAILTAHGFYQTADDNSSPTCEFFSYTSYSDSLYISLEASRKNVSNQFKISCDFLYNGNFDDQVAASQTNIAAFKKSPNVPTGGPVTHSIITLRIAPNPFDVATHILLNAPKDIPLKVSVYDVLGRLVSDLYDGINTDEHYDFTLDGQTITPGTYFIRVQAGNEVETRKVEFVR